MQINTTGSNSIGVYAAGLGQVNLGNGSVIKTSTNGAHTNAYGLYANGTSGASSITASNLTVETGSKNGHAIYAANAGGEIYINGANNKVTTTGESAYGLIASRTGSQIIVSDKINITTTGEKSHGVSVSNVGGVGSVLVDLGTGSVVNTNNLSASGLVSNHLGAFLTAKDINVNTGTGTSSYGAYVLDQAALQLSGGQIVTAGSNAHGVYAIDTGTAVTLDNISISTTGSGAHAIMSNIGAETTITQNNNILSSTQGTTLYSEGGVIEATLNGSFIQNNGLLVNAKVDTNSGLSSHINLNAENLSMSGDIQAESASIANLSLSNAAWSGRATNGTDFKLDGSSVWNMIASSDVANLNHAGRINFVTPTGNNFSILTVRNNYIGNGGIITLHTKLDSDGSPSDRLVVTGNTSGNSQLHITNAGGMGALTTENGIQVVEVVGNSSAGTFKLNNDVFAGAYSYQLQQTDKDWYLTSYVTPGQGPSPNEGPNIPTYRPDAGVSIGNQQSVIEMMISNPGIAGSGAMRSHIRLGGGTVEGTFLGQKSNNLWSFATVNDSRGRAAHGQISYSTKSNTLQIGGDRIFALGNGLIQAGAMAHMSTAKSKSFNRFTGARAMGDSDGYGFGLYAQHGSYVQMIF